ncbi:MAG: hypothetical protein FWG99_09135 [Treponema sp.]|nr:hypothetical protein [Treponema sp.]
MKGIHSKIIFCACFLIFIHTQLFAQTHTSVPLDNHVYYILEQAALRGLCTHLSGIRPYTQSVVIKAINEILSSDNSIKLSRTERDILNQYLEKNSKPETGIDWQRGAYYNETAVTSLEIPLSINLGVSAELEGSVGLYYPKENYFGNEIWAKAYLNGDLGRNLSYEFSVMGGLVTAPRQYLGLYNTYYEGFQDNGEFQNQLINVYSEPLTHFPYSYKKRWDASVHYFDDLAGFEAWPESTAGAYNILSELTGSFFEGILTMRLGRLSHEWGSTPYGSSLVLNQTARPFVGMEYEFRPFSWFSIASMTGFLEFYNLKGEKESGGAFQNAYSITMLQFNYKNYFFLDIGETVVWPKRFELGYMSPVTNTFFYKNNVGDFDNLGVVGNIRFQYPGLGNIWFSLFVDEMKLERDWYKLDRTMIATQAGLSFPLPFMAFSSVKMSYTMIYPYCYTHNRNYTPWYGEVSMEQAYINNGVGIGYYLPPNSDEILIQFRTMPVKSLTALLQYQLIRHGADFGPSAVDGSNLYSELDPDGRSDNPILRRFFLMDGAYQWSHIIKLGAEWAIPKIPAALYAEAGTLISYFTDIEAGKANTGTPYPYSAVNTPDYPRSTGFIFKLGLRVFP